MAKGQLGAVLDALGNERRRKIVELVATKPRTAGEVAAAFTEVTWPAISRHLSILHEAGVLEREGGGRAPYQVNRKALATVRDWAAGKAR